MMGTSNNGLHSLVQVTCHQISQLRQIDGTSYKVPSLW